MAQPQTVKVVEVCRVAPAPDLPNSASPLSLPLTFFDLLWLRFPPVQQLFFYEIPSPNTPLFDSVIQKLKHSLALTLHHFYPLCGNLLWPQDSTEPTLSYVDGDGVSLTIAESNLDFYHLSSNNFRDALACHPLIPQLEVSREKASVMALQVTVFPKAGFSIGITTHHAVLDGKTIMSFVKSWSQICKTDSPSVAPELAQFYDREVITDEAGLGAVYLNEWLNHGGPDNRSLTLLEKPVSPSAVRGTFQLSKGDIDKLRKVVSGGDPSKRVSTFSLVVGYVWACLERAKEVKDKEAILVFNVDCRPRLKPEIPPGYFGNCIARRYVVVDTEEVLGENGVTVAVDAITAGVKGLDKDGVLNGAETWVSALNKSEPKSATVTGVAGSPRFEVYNIDFGWGKPRKAEVTSIDKARAMSLSEAKNGNGGVEIALVLMKQEMETFASSFAKGLQG